MKIVISLLGLLSVALAWGEKQPFSRYQSIIDRQMFGQLPPDFDPTKMPSEVSKSSGASEKQLSQEQEKLQSSIHFSVINLTPEGEIAVGFTDNSDPKLPVHYYLKVGETRNGWTVKAADPSAATMTIAKGEVEVSLSLGGNSAQDAGATSKAESSAAAEASGEPRRPFGMGLGSLGGGGTLRSRRLMREQKAQEAKAAADAAAAAKEAERQEQAAADKAQREAERAEQRQQLLAIQEELRRVRESKAQQQNENEETNANESY